MRLSDLTNSQSGIITKVMGRGAFRKRIIEMGFIRGQEVIVIKNAPLKDPIEYKIMGYDVSLRRSEANLIEVITQEEALNIDLNKYEGVIPSEILKVSVKEKSKEINVVLVGNPNSGKTTLFNYASNSREHVGNYSGVTIDAKIAEFKHNDYTFKITDLPGTYSLTAYSPEELFVRKHIFDNVPDVIINVIDSSNLERNLYLTTQLIDMDLKVVVALNMYDELQAKGDSFDYNSMGKMIGIPIIPTVSSKRKGIKELFDKVVEVYEDKDPILRHIHINYGNLVEQSIKAIQKNIKTSDNLNITDKTSSRFLAIKMLEKDKDVNNLLKDAKNYSEINQTATNEIKRIESILSEDSETIITDAKYGFISGALKETYHKGVHSERLKTEIIDTFLTHKLFGFPIFIFFMWVMFQATFTIGSYPMDWIDSLVSLISQSVEKFMPDGSLKDLLVNGIIGGVGGVIVFLPNILILFFFISLMEDTGYMARTAFIMDKLMHKIGLHGKSFIPLLMGFGCNVPAIMATRTIENRNDRLLTMLINPFMSCSARLPVYVLLIGAFFPNSPGTVLFTIYTIGILVAILVSLLFKKVLFKSQEAPFVMELPPYRVPTLNSIVKHMWSKGFQYLKKMGGVILIASIIIWALGYFPREVKFSQDYDKQIAEVESAYEASFLFGDESKEKIALEKELAIGEIENQKIAEKQEKSFIGQLGHFIEPAIKPLGFDWKMGVSLITGMAAKEIVVSTMGVLYQRDNNYNKQHYSLDDKPKELDETENLMTKLRNQTYSDGRNVFTPLIAFGFMIFILLYLPCIATVAAIRKESGSWKWAAFTVFYTTAIAWIASFLVYNIGNLFL